MKLKTLRDVSEAYSVALSALVELNQLPADGLTLGEAHLIATGINSAVNSVARRRNDVERFGDAVSAGMPFGWQREKESR